MNEKDTQDALDGFLSEEEFLEQEKAAKEKDPEAMLKAIEKIFKARGLEKLINNKKGRK